MDEIYNLNELAVAQATDLSGVLAEHRARAFPPTATKRFRRLSGSEVNRLLDVADSRMRQIASDLGVGESSGGRRTYSLEDLAALRAALGAKDRTRTRYLPNRRNGEPLQVICTMNFKGGSAKTTTCAHLLQYLAMRGYRVLGIDLDPQASLSAFFGVYSAMDLEPGGTIYSALRYDSAQAPLRDLVKQTYVPGLALLPGGLELMEFEHETPRAFQHVGPAGVFARLATAISSIEADYDVIVIDCPPQLGYLTLCGLVAADDILITVHPEMLDVMSMTQFLIMLGDITTVIFDALPAHSRPRFRWLRYLLTRFEPNDAPQAQMAALLRARFGDFVMLNSALKSTAISDAGLTNQTLYEVERNQFTRSTYDRAVESIDAVNREIEVLIHKAWGRP